MEYQKGVRHKKAAIEAASNVARPGIYTFYSILLFLILKSATQLHFVK